MRDFLQSGGATRWRVCYQRGLPRLVLITCDCKKNHSVKYDGHNVYPSHNVLPGQICLLFGVFHVCWSLAADIPRQIKDMPQGYRVFTTQQNKS